MTRALVLSLIFAAFSSFGCASISVMRGEISGLEKLTEQAQRNGAKRCAPRELAKAQAHTRFATVELDQANSFRAEDHLIVARANAQAAYDLSPPSKCSDRRFSMAKPIPEPGDKDGDGYPDNSDQCPEQPENFQGFKDEDGCPDDPDTDGDGIADSKDACELLPEDVDTYLDADGCPDVDNDLDGIVDAKDQCKMEPEDPDAFKDDDGCPEPDNDVDKLVDTEDQCPNIPGVNEPPRPGCPKKPSIVIVTDTEIKITQQIHFAFAKSDIRPISFPVLDAVVDVLKKNPDMKIEVQGHTDNVGTPQYNKSLSQSRANAVRDYLVKKGIARDRLTAKGFGLEKPLVPNDSDKNRALNRRVQFVRTEKK